MTDHAEAQMLITLSGVAALAHVQRPVVSMWRTRSAGSNAPFPSPVRVDRGQERFDAIEVAAWLALTGRGNNPEAAADAGRFAHLHGADLADPSAFAAITALIALRGSAGTALGELDRNSLLDLADTFDPDDESLMAEIESLGSPASLARFVDVLVDSAYDAGAAFEAVMGGRFRDGQRDLIGAALDPSASSLIASVALELAATNPAGDPSAATFVDPTGASGDLLVQIAATAAEHVEVTVRTADADGSTARLVRRRLQAHGITRGSVAADDGSVMIDGHGVHVFQLPSGRAARERALDLVDEVQLRMDDRQRAVVVGPSALLCDGGLDESAALVRSEALRGGRVRAIVKLPRGLLVANPRQSLALWVLGPAHANVPLAERWTLLADLTDVALTGSVRTDLVSDLVAAMGDAREVRAHAFRFARFTLTSSLLAEPGSLVHRAPVADGGVTRRSPDDVAARLDQVIAGLGGEPLRLDRIRPGDGLAIPAASIGTLVEQKLLRYLPGVRLGDDEVSSGSGFTVIGVAELDGAQIGARTVDRLRFAVQHENARLTEPGDVVFAAGSRFRAIVDHVGSSVVAYPARILRIPDSDDAGLVPAVLCADIRSATSREWRRWMVRRVPPAQCRPLADTMADIRSARAQLEACLALMNELEHLVSAAVSHGAVTLTEGAD